MNRKRAENDPSYPSGRPGAKKEIPVDSIFHDSSHPSIAVNLDACIACGLCERACREVQVNDVIGMGKRGMDAMPIFDVLDPMGISSCVACGECVQACPTGALMEKTLLDETSKVRTVYPDKKVESVCPFCGVGRGCAAIMSTTTSPVKKSGFHHSSHSSNKKVADPHPTTNPNSNSHSNSRSFMFEQL